MHSRLFIYEYKNHKKTVMPYWLVPEEIMKDKNRIRKWVDKSVAVSSAGKVKK